VSSASWPTLLCLPEFSVGQEAYDARQVALYRWGPPRRFRLVLRKTSPVFRALVALIFLSAPPFSAPVSGWTDSGFTNLIWSAACGYSGNCATFDFWYWLAGELFSVKWDGAVVFPRRPCVWTPRT
jgi:hypothetical protein